MFNISAIKVETFFFLDCLLFRYCPLCKNDASEVVQAGEKLKESKKKAKMASNVNQSNRDWGRVSEKDIFSICTLSWLE